MLLKTCRSLLARVFSNGRNSAERPKAVEIRQVDVLEQRQMLSATTFTARDQLLLELINRARQDPGAEAARFGIGLNDGVSAQNTISDTPKAPLAANDALATAARLHSQDMIDRNFFSHTAPAPAPNGATDDERAAAQGYTGAVGENIGWSGRGDALDGDAYTFIRHERLFRSQGHRVNMLRDLYVEAGTGVRTGRFTHSDGETYNSIFVTENFGTYFGAGNSFLTGVVFNDATSGVANNDFYDIGEGQGGSITAYSTTSSDTYEGVVGNAGGWSLRVPDGTYDVVYTSPNNEQYIVRNTAIAGQNAKVDFELTTAEAYEAPQNLPDTLAYNTASHGWWAGIISEGGEGNPTLTNVRYAQWSTAVDWQHTMTGDFNGDGMLDGVGWDPTSGNWFVGLNNGSSFDTSLWGRWAPTAGWQNLVVGDFNGDGNDDIAGRTASGNWFVGQSDGTEFTTTRRGVWTKNLTWGNVQVGDFNGDGNDDIAGRHDRGHWFVSAGSAVGGSFTTTRYTWWTPALEWKHIRVADFDGNGMDDIVGIAGSTGNAFVSLANGTKFDTTLWGRFGRNVDLAHAVVGQFGGDSNPDYMLWNTVTGNWAAGISTSSAFSVNTSFAYWNPATDWQQVRTMPIANGTDALVALGTSPNNGQWHFSDIADDETPLRIGTWGPSRYWTDLVVGQMNADA